MIRIRQIKLELKEDSLENLQKKVASKLRVNKKDIFKIEITKKSIDAREKKHIYYVYEVDIEVKNERKILEKNQSKDIFKKPKEVYSFLKSGTKALEHRPIIVGSGPAGLFCAYLLAEAGYHPIVMERGEKIESRVKTVDEFFETGMLNKDSNVQFGEGGAGTFSDGKLNTLVKDKYFRGKKVFEILVENGAPPEIMYLNKPHIGTDLLQQVIINIRKKIIQMGGEFRYHHCVTNVIVKDKKIQRIEVNHQDQIPCEVLVLAIGHSARDTFEMLYQQNISMSPKPFAVGIRIQHPQQMINQNQYGENILEPASYKLTYQSSNKRGVYSFCMCPGGYVVNASSESKKLAINGMSNHARNSKNANSAIVVTVSPDDFGYHPLDGVNYQRNLEEKAYQFGSGKIPIQLYKDYKGNKITKKLGQVEPLFKGNYQFANLNEIFPSYINDALKEGIENFSHKIKNFNRDDAILAAVESRTSSPIRIHRDETFQSNISGLFPCGEGAGYAGGITTSAIDGIKVAESIAKIYKNE